MTLNLMILIIFGLARCHQKEYSSHVNIIVFSKYNMIFQENRGIISIENKQ